MKHSDEKKILEERLKESEDRYRAIAEDTPALICRFLPSGKITYVNHSYCRYFEKSSKELVGTKFLTLIPENDQTTVMQNIASLTAGAPIQSHEHRVISADGHIRWQRWTNRGLFDKHGNVRAYQSIGEDITDKKKAAEALQAANQQLTASNQQLSATEQQLRASNQQLQATEQQVRATNQQLRATEQQLRATNQQLIASNQQLRVKERSLEIENHLKEIFLTLPDDNMYYEILKVVLDAVKSKYGVFGYINEKGDLIVPSMSRHIWPKCKVPDKNIVFPKDNWGPGSWPRAIREKKANHTNDPSTNVPEGHIPIRRHMTQPLIYKGEVVGLFQVANKETDYTDDDIKLLEGIGNTVGPILNARLERDRFKEKGAQAERILKESEEKYRILFKSASDAILIIDVESFGVLDANEAAINLYGYSYDELMNMKAMDLSNEAAITKLTIEASQETINGIRYHRKKDGQVFPVEITSNHFEFQGGKIMILAIRDITARQKTEDSLHRLAMAIDQVAESVEITDKEPRILYVNPAFEKITGYSPKEAIGQNPRFLQSGKHHRSFYEEMWGTLLKGQVWRGQFHNKRKDGSMFYEDASISPVLDNNGHIINYVAVKRDISKELEIERRLQQALKMEAIGTLAGGIAHDFNNILTAVIGFTELALDEAEPSSLQEQNLKEVFNAGKRAKDLVHQILSFARQADEEIKPLQVDLVVKEAMRLIRSTVPTTIKIQYELQSQSLTMADATQIHQVVMNLCTNAAQAMDHGGLMTIELKDTIFDENYTPNPPGLKKGSFINLRISDTGCGIPQDMVDLIFEPYFTTKPIGEGTGMGLATVYGIVKQYGGEVNVKSSVNKGTRFDVYLPIYEQHKQMHSYQVEELPTGNEKILFVDDELPIAKMGSQILNKLGYEVTVRTSSVEALVLFNTNPDEYDLVITDMTMPNMAGDKLAIEMMKLRPDIPIIICTGYSKRISEESASMIGVKALAYKPLVKAELAITIRNVLDQVILQG